MSTYEITYLPHTQRAPEQIEASGHTVDESTTPPTHRFHARGRTMSAQLIERTDVESVRELQPDAAVEQASQSPLPPFARQVSNRAFPKGHRPGSDR